jgi:hypothetical protein
MQRVARHHVRSEGFDQRIEEPRGFADPIGERRAGEIHTFALIDL